jgi:hypothetical protein
MKEIELKVRTMDALKAQLMLLDELKDYWHVGIVDK